MAIALVGLNHTTASVAVRERLAFSDAALADALTTFRAPEVEELVVLSTCNRVEFYMQGRDVAACNTACESFLAAYHALAPEDFAPHLYYLSELEAVRHVFRVAASLDSMVLGEPQILGQVKAAYYAARDAGRTGTIFHYLFERAFNVAKAARSETGISDHAVSVSYAAVQLAKKIFEDLRRHTVMILGAGETSEMAARHFVRQGVGEVFVANRTAARARKTGAEPLRQGHPLGRISRTSGAYRYRRQLDQRSESRHHARHGAGSRARRGAGEPCFSSTLPCRATSTRRSTRWKTFFFTTSTAWKTSWRQIVANVNRKHWRLRTMIWREVRHFRQWLATRDVVPTIVALRRHAEATRLRELEKALAKLEPLDERQRHVSSRP